MGITYRKKYEFSWKGVVFNLCFFGFSAISLTKSDLFPKNQPIIVCFWLACIALMARLYIPPCKLVYRKNEVKR